MGNAAVARWAACLLRLANEGSKVGSEGLGQARQEPGNRVVTGGDGAGTANSRERGLLRE